MKVVFIVMTALAAAILTGCAAGYDVETWQEVSSVPRAAEQRDALADELQQVDALRKTEGLTPSRTLALSLVAENPQDPGALWRAARAESDAVLLHHPHEEDQRALAALSALDYAERAEDSGADGADALGWLAFSRGSSTHLRPMLSRAAVARSTEDAALRALDVDPNDARAHLTLAILNYRLATLPWIAKTMAFGEPASSLEDAERHARAAMMLAPGVETSLVLAKILRALDRPDEALAMLEAALAEDDRQPRDPYHRDEARALRNELAAAPESTP